VSFDISTRSVTRAIAEIFSRKAMCFSAFFFENSQKEPDAKVLRFESMKIEKTFSSIESATVKLPLQSSKALKGIRVTDDKFYQLRLCSIS